MEASMESLSLRSSGQRLSKSKTARQFNSSMIKGTRKLRNDPEITHLLLTRGNTRSTCCNVRTCAAPNGLEVQAADVRNAHSHELIRIESNRSQRVQATHLIPWKNSTESNLIGVFCHVSVMKCHVISRCFEQHSRHASDFCGRSSEEDPCCKVPNLWNGNTS